MAIRKARAIPAARAPIRTSFAAFPQWHDPIRMPLMGMLEPRADWTPRYRSTQPGHAAALPLLSPRPFTADRALAPPFRPAWHRPRAESGREPEAGGLPGTLRRAIGAAEAGGATPSPLGMSTSWPGKDGREVPSVGAFGVVLVPDADIHVVRAQEIRPV